MSVEGTIATAVGAIVIVGLPAYIGWTDRAIGVFLLYALVAGVALATADRLTVSHFKGDSAMAFAHHAAIRLLTVALVGGAIYGLLIVAV